MKCHEFQDLIEAYLQETIDEARRERFEEHFFQCRKCFLGLQINETLRNKEVRISLKEKPRLFVFKVLKPMLAMSSLFLLILLSALLLRQNRQARQLEEIARIRASPVPPGRTAEHPGTGRRAGIQFFPGHAAVSGQKVRRRPGHSRTAAARRPRLSQGPILSRHLLSRGKRTGPGRRDTRCPDRCHGPGLFRRSALLQGFRPAAPGPEAGRQGPVRKDSPACSAPCPGKPGPWSGK